MTAATARPRDRGLALIALYKFTKATLLILAGAGMLSLLRPDVAEDVRRWLLQLTVARGLRVVDMALTTLNLAQPRRIQEFGLGAIIYGLLFATEGTGLWMRKRWAEYLTVVTTSLLIPVEIYELARRLTVVRAGTLIVNVALVVYLVYRLRRHNPDQAERPPDRRVVRSDERSARGS